MRSSRRRLRRLRASLRRKAGTDMLILPCRLEGRFQRPAYPNARRWIAVRAGFVALTSSVPTRVAEGVLRDWRISRGRAGWEWR